MIIIDQKYKEAVKQVCNAASNRAQIQAFENIMIRTGDNQVELKAGDSLIELTKIVPCEVKSGFETTVNAAKFLQSFNACAGDVTVTLKEKMTIKSGKRRFMLPVVPVESYPEYPEMDGESKIDCPKFIDIVKSVSWAAGVDDARHYFNGVYVSKDAVATNGHKMSVAEIGCDTDMIVPIATVKRLPDISGDIFASDTVLCIKSDDTVFKTKLVDGRYVQYQRAIPTCDKSVTVNTSEFTDSVKAAQITANSQFKTVLLYFGSESSVSATSADRREESLIGFECDAPEEFEFAVNSTYLVESLASVKSDTVTIGFTDSQMMIESDGVKSIISAVKL